jgi:hypothetical protein
MATSSLSSSCWASSTVVLGLGKLAVASTCRRRLPLVRCRCAARALPRHATVVSPGRCVSVPLLLLLLCILL